VEEALYLVLSEVLALLVLELEAQRLLVELVLQAVEVVVLEVILELVRQAMEAQDAVDQAEVLVTLAKAVVPLVVLEAQPLIL
jgi:hypothetical protein